jgi:hypothetical protein
MARVLIVFVIGLSLACSEQREARYRTVAELKTAGAGARSWFPVWLPHEATALREQHDLDTNRSIGRFTSTRSFEPPSSLCKPVRFSRSPSGESWWPDESRFLRLEHRSCLDTITYADGHAEPSALGVAVDRRMATSFSGEIAADTACEAVIVQWE